MAMLPAMHSEAGLWVEAGLLIFTFFVVVPSIAAVIGYAAWKGKPKNFSREMYWTVFAAAVATSLFLMVFAQRMQADVEHGSIWSSVLALARVHFFLESLGVV